MRKGCVRGINQSQYTEYHYGGQKTHIIYPSGRRCSKCGNKLSEYNGMNECNPCWRGQNFPHEENELSFKLECELINRAVAKW